MRMICNFFPPLCAVLRAKFQLSNADIHKCSCQGEPGYTFSSTTLEIIISRLDIVKHFISIGIVILKEHIQVANIRSIKWYLGRSLGI